MLLLFLSVIYTVSVSYCSTTKFPPDKTSVDIIFLSVMYTAIFAVAVMIFNQNFM